MCLARIASQVHRLSLSGPVTNIEYWHCYNVVVYTYWNCQEASQQYPQSCGQSACDSRPALEPLDIDRRVGSQRPCCPKRQLHITQLRQPWSDQDSAIRRQPHQSCVERLCLQLSQLSHKLSSIIFASVNRIWANETFEIQTLFGVGEDVAVFGSFTYRSRSLGQVSVSPFPIWCKVNEDGKGEIHAIHGRHSWIDRSLEKRGTGAICCVRRERRNRGLREFGKGYSGTNSVERWRA